MELPNRLTSTVLRNQCTRISNRLKLLQTFSDSYKLNDIVNPSFCYLFYLTAILNLSCTHTVIFSILQRSQSYLFYLMSIVNLSDTYRMDWETIANLSKDILRQIGNASRKTIGNISYASDTHLKPHHKVYNGPRLFFITFKL